MTNDGVSVHGLDDYSPATRHDVAKLAGSVNGLRDELARFATVEQVARDYVSREDAEVYAAENRRVRRRVALTITASVVLAFIISMGANNTAISSCFLHVSYHHSAWCNTLFPGYNGAVDTTNARLAQEQQVFDQIRRNQSDIAMLQRRQTDLSRAILKLLSTHH